MKFAIVAAVLVFVSQAVQDGVRELSQRDFQFAIGPALAAGVAYFSAQLVMAWFWRRVLVALGQPAPPGASIAAFCISQLGKYVPGKASVVLIRTERLLASLKRRPYRGEWQASIVKVGASAFYETLSYMAVGSLLAAALIPFVSADAGQNGWVILLALGLAAVCLTPTLPPVFGWVLGRFTVASGRAELREQLRGRLGYGLAATAAFASTVAWILMGVCVWLSAEAVGAAGGLGIGNLPFWTLAATLPSVAGFVSLLPAGLLVREGLALLLLAPVLGDGDAVAVTVASRLIGVATEVVVCASLIAGGFARNRPRRDPNGDPS
ncbi:lysylphosphatidylglycerol synthase domain-containing protein [Botrimarina colliarenosi]|uniref:lysylphosphatidylglycerol synthase domain-containing protein n=1 Tax=Botrimarina colliarenosi TaxID=2528001 RepID=UPI0018D3CCC7|nr:lysylphosphatidylglycerol synthase domain-containing protein [Botrimarina colliarenosi]